MMTTKTKLETKMNEHKLSKEILDFLETPLKLQHFIMKMDDYLSMVSSDRKNEMIELWGSLPPAIEIMAGEISPVWAISNDP